MRIIVCVKQVPDTAEVKIDPKTGTLIREGVPSILNPDDANALELALQIKDVNPDTEIVLLTMGPKQAVTMLRECLAMGADGAYLLSDRAFAGADTCATSLTLAAAIQKIGGYDLILAGRQAIDGDTAQVGPQIAERLGLPQVTYVEHCIIPDTKQTESLTVRRQLEDGYETVEVTLPAVLTAVKELNQPRYMTLGGIVTACDMEITVWSMQDLGLEAEEVGLKASPTQVYRSFAPPQKAGGVKLTGSVTEMVAKLVEELNQAHIIG